MTYFLDTDIIIDMLKDRESKPVGVVELHPKRNIKIPSIVKGELITGAYKKGNVEFYLENIRDILFGFEVVPFDDSASEIYGKIRAELEMKGNVIGPNDLMIAATTLSRGGILVTNNTKEFSRVEGLQLENWSK